MDLTIPGGMGGERTIRELLSFDPEVLAIVSSGYAESPVIANYEQYGFKGFIAKPYTVSKLEEALGNALSKKK